MSAAGLTDEQIAKARALRATGKTCYRTARQLGIPVGVVRAIAPPKSGPYRVLPYSVEEVREMRRQGATFLEIGVRLKLNADVASRLCHDIPLDRVRHRERVKQARDVADAELEAAQRVVADRRHRAGIKAGTRREKPIAKAIPAPIRMPERVDVEVPGWVPGALRDLYVELADRDCEESAASVVRQLKISGSVVCR